MNLKVLIVEVYSRGREEEAATIGTSGLGIWAAVA